jgi:lipopolysaccharide export system permease protein
MGLRRVIDGRFSLFGCLVGTLRRYIVVEVLKGSIVALACLLALYNLFTFSDQMKDVGKGHYGLPQVLLYLTLTTPRMIYELMPSAALLGSLFVMGSMANNREVVAMRAGGLSIAWVIRSIMTAGVFLVLFSVLVGEFVAPDSERSAQFMRQTAMNENVVMKSKYGMWLRESNEFINVRHIADDGGLEDVRVFDVAPDHRLNSMIQAASAKHLEGQHWVLKGVSRSSFAGDKVEAQALAELDWYTSIDTDLLKVTIVDYDNLSLYDLYNYIQFLKANNQNAKKFELAFWGRVVNPLVTFVMLLVSAPFVVSIGRGSSVGARLMLGVLIGVCFNIIDSLSGNFGLFYNISPALIAFLPTLIVFVLAMYGLSRML